MLVIGFSTHYYTLWNVNTYTKVEVIDGYAREYEVTKYNYQQNLSFDLDAAKAKVEAMVDHYEIDLELRGSKSWWTKREITKFELWQFTFGKLTGYDMRSENDVWQLTRAMKTEPNPRRRVYARARLIELGELVKYTWFEREQKFTPCTREQYVMWLTEQYVSCNNSLDWAQRNAEMAADQFLEDHGIYELGVQVKVKRKYCPAKLASYLKDQEKINARSGHHFENGKRITLQVREVKIKSFDSQYGTVYIQWLETATGEIVKYKGGSPLSFNEPGKVFEWVEIKATIEHGEYNEQKETRIKRMALTAAKA